MLRGVDREQLYQPFSSGSVSHQSGKTRLQQCAAWVALDRGRAFLADVGAGTVDQALLGVPPSRHAALLLFGLAQRALINDEVHAHDAYMSRELETVVAFQTALGGGSIVLSATLPQDRRAALVAAFHRGTGGIAPVPTSSHYPLVTLVTADGGGEHRCDPRAESSRMARVERLGPLRRRLPVSPWRRVRDWRWPGCATS